MYILQERLKVILMKIRKIIANLLQKTRARSERQNLLEAKWSSLIKWSQELSNGLVNSFHVSGETMESGKEFVSKSASKIAVVFQVASTVKNQ